MKKLLILLLACSFFTACNNNKANNQRDNGRTDNRNKDDYRNNNDKNKEGNTNYTNDNNNTDKGGWSSSDVKKFVDNCVSTAVNNGNQEGFAKDYCNCMQKKLERKYPNANDISTADLNSPEIKDMEKDCNGGN